MSPLGQENIKPKLQNGLLPIFIGHVSWWEQMAHTETQNLIEFWQFSLLDEGKSLFQPSDGVRTPAAEKPAAGAQPFITSVLYLRVFSKCANCASAILTLI